MLTGGAPLQVDSLYGTQLTFSTGQTAVGQTSCFTFMWNAYSRITKMAIHQQLEQRINITFLVKLGKNAQKSIKCCNRFMECVQVFREGREDPKDDAMSGRPSTSRGNKTSIVYVLSCSVTAD